MTKKTLARLAFAAVCFFAVDLHAERLTYTVEAGDVLGSIALEHGVSVEQLRSWNNLDGDLIYAGQQLVIHTDRARRSSGGGEMTYVVAAGDTLGGIAQRLGCSVDDLVSWNRGLDPDRIRIGQELNVRASSGRPMRRIVYEVQSGDFVGSIARRNNVSIQQLVSWNRGLDPDRVQIGQELVMYLEGPEVRSESVGQAFGGRLVNGEQLPDHRGFSVRDRNRAWGTNETITAIIEGFDHVQRTYPGSPRVSVHDLSDEDGGRLPPHRSHQSGRDADIGYYHSRCGRSDCDYVAVRPSELDVERNWALFSYWIENDQIEYVFVDYGYQRVLYDWLRENGASDSELSRWFQYPHGRNAARGIIRHEPGHDDHMHVRFACPDDDAACQ